MQRTAGSAPSVDAVRLWLEMRTTLASEDAERYSAAFVEDGATSLDLLVNAGYNKEVRGCVEGSLLWGHDGEKSMCG